MPFNTLLLPLLGGYIFVQRWNRTRYSNNRHSGQRLLFHSAISGLAFLSLAYLLSYATGYLFPRVVSEWQTVVPFAYSGTSAVGFLLGATAWVPLNRWIHDRGEEAQRVIDEWNDWLEMLLHRAMRDTQQVAVTTSSRKFYIGFITNNFNPAYERKYISLLPTLSGYRHPERLTFEITTNYSQVYSELLDNRLEFLVDHADNFEVVIPVDEVASAKTFDPDAFELFRQFADQPDSEVHTTTPEEGGASEGQS